MWGATPAFHAGLAKALPQAEFVDCDRLADRSQAAQVGRRDRAHIAASCAGHTSDAVEAATSTAVTRRVSLTATSRARLSRPWRGRAESIRALSPIVTSGRRSGHPALDAQERHKIQPGDNVLLEIGACVQRYTAPQMRTLTIGPPSAEVRGAAEACIAALNAVLGTPCGRASLRSDAAEAGWRELAAAGDDLVFHGNFGYGIGAGFPPNWADASGFLQRDQDTVLEAWHGLSPPHRRAAAG